MFTPSRGTQPWPGDLAKNLELKDISKTEPPEFIARSYFFKTFSDYDQPGISIITEAFEYREFPCDDEADTRLIEDATISDDDYMSLTYNLFLHVQHGI